MPGISQILLPDIPTGIAKLATTVATTKKIHLQHTPPNCGESSCLERGHSPRFVHLVTERVYIQNSSLAFPVWMRLMKKAETLSQVGLQKERLCMSRAWIRFHSASFCSTNC